MCQVQNEALAKLTAARPRQLSAVGAVPVQDPALAARDITEPDDPRPVRRRDPVQRGRRYLGDEHSCRSGSAAERPARCVIHPSTRGFGLPALDGHYLWNSVGNPLETAVTAAHIAVAGVLERYPRLRILLAHGGGALPVVRGRLRRAFAVRPEARAQTMAGPDQSLRRSTTTP